MNMLGLIISLWTLNTICVAAGSQPCALRDLGNNKRVCVCNTTYCDTIEGVTHIGKNQFVIYRSTLDGERFNVENGTFNQNEEKIEKESNSVYSWLSGSITQQTTVFTVNISAKYQIIHGFGGAFTDATGINIRSLPEELQETLLRSYFSEEGIEYYLCRLPIGGTDFSTHPYSYDDGLTDPNLINFQLKKEDFEYKIPFILKALKMSKKKIKFVAAAWSPPPWMKMNNDYTAGFLKPEYYDVYAKYLLKFLDEYKKHNISVWAISTGNEPTNIFFPFVITFNVLGWTPSSLTSWIVHNFGPSLRSSQHNQTKILTYDDQRGLLHWWMKKMLETDKRVFDYIDGIAVHWYWDFLISVGVVEKVHNEYPSKFLLYTEACNGYRPWEKKVLLGSWERAEAYVENIIENLNNWVTGWIDWNLCLNKQGGPNWVKNFVDSPIIVDPENKEFLKQPMFYALGHFSKFVGADAVRVGISQEGNSDVRAVALRNPDGRVVIVIINKSNSNKNLSIKVLNKGSIDIEVPPRSFSTILFDE